MERQPDQHHEYEGQPIVLRNIFWTTHLEKGLGKAIWIPKDEPWTSEVCYAPIL